MKRIKIITWILVAISFISFFLYSYYKDNIATKYYINRTYNGIIQEIAIIENDRGIPNIRINNKWLFLGMSDSKVKHYIKTGDSISKQTGEIQVKVYRKNNSGVWIEKIFN